MKTLVLGLCGLGLALSSSWAEPLSVSGIYPGFATFNGEGECGIGAVVPWAGRLWWITYPPHMTKGSPDKLYSVKPDMSDFTLHAESVGGTHACRMIHKESNQLIIGPYFISAEGKVRVVDVKTRLIGRMTAVARHLTDPANRVYFYDMEGALYEVDVHSLEVTKLFQKPVPGWHGKGGYTSQGRLVISNNGESPAGKEPKEFLAKLPPKSNEDAGVLAEWNGKDWRIIERREFLDVTGPGGIHGAPDDKSPLWTVGWDKRSLMLKLLDGGKWSTYRLPKASYAFDPKHGWYTEWPRIRDLDEGKFMAVLHGQMFDFPGTFSATNTAGIRPVCTHLRYVPDLAQWGDRLVIASDDTSIMLNPLAGQSQSNLWFGSKSDLKTWGPTCAWGGVWIGDHVKAGVASDPFLVAGYARRVLHLSQNADTPAAFKLEADARGDGHWAVVGRMEVPAHAYRWQVLDGSLKAEWLRLVPEQDSFVSAYLHMSNESPHPLAAAFGKSASDLPVLVRPAKGNRNLEVSSGSAYYEVNEKLELAATTMPKEAEAIMPKWRIEPDATVDAASVVLTDHEGKRWRLPKTDDAFDKLAARGLREIESERYTGNWHGSMYEIPRKANGAKDMGTKELDFPDFAKMRPVCTHRLPLTDFCTWRGLLVMAGAQVTSERGKTITSADGKASLWLGKTDDLWSLGKPQGHGGPWKGTATKAGVPSDPYLMTNYDRKTLSLTHDGAKPVKFTVEVDFLANGFWREYETFTVEPGKSFVHEFPTGYSAHWLRVKADADCVATAQLIYE